MPIIAPPLLQPAEKYPFPIEETSILASSSNSRLDSEIVIFTSCSSDLTQKMGLILAMKVFQSKVSIFTHANKM
jgi:hypothetical protein